MNRTLKVTLLAAMAILLVLPACTRNAPGSVFVATPTELMFPASTSDPFAAVLTQTAAVLPAQPTNTVEVVAATVTPQPGGGGDPSAGEPDAGGGQAVTSTTAPLPIPPTVRPETHTIEKGEFPYCLARRYDLDPSSFLALNGLGNNSQVSIGTVLRIPSTGTWDTSSLGSRALRAHPTTYTIPAGETVAGVACKFGDVTPEQILAANGKTSPSELQAGQTIQIP